MTKKIKKEIIDLVKDLNRYSEAYYNEDQSIISDHEYDLLLKKLEKLETDYPPYKQNNSPTERVGFKTLDYLEKDNHDFPMLSLQNALNKNEFQEFYHRIAKELKTDSIDDLEFFVEPKIDGVSISLIYENGKLIKALTRGDGVIGEVVTQNALQIFSIPSSIPFEGKVTVRGEVYESLSNFKKINQESARKFANPRNFASGTLRLLNPLVVRKRRLNALFYQIFFYEENNDQPKTQQKIFEWLELNNFPTFKNSKSIKGYDDLIKQLDYFDHIRKELDFEIDGAVVKVNDISLHNQIGSTIKFPKWAIAFKFSPTIVETELIDIFPTVGRTGLVVYNAKLKPVSLSGSIVSFATLHNLEYIHSLDLRIGDIVEVKKSGEIIPKVIKPNLDKRKDRNLDKWKELEFCPFCDTKLVLSETKNNQFCINDSCPSRKINQLLHFVSKEAMDIDGMGDKILNLFFSLGFIREIIDIFNLKDKKEELINLDGFKERSISKILNSIEKSKKKSLEHLIFGLGIKHIGFKSSLDLSKRFQNLDEIVKLNYEDLVNEEDFGGVKAQSLVDYFKEPNNLELINQLREKGLNFNYLQNKTLPKENQESRFYKKVVVISGTFSDVKRKEAESILSSIGAIVRKSISPKTDFLIIGENPSDNKISSIEPNKIIQTIILKDIL